MGSEMAMYTEELTALYEQFQHTLMIYSVVALVLFVLGWVFFVFMVKLLTRIITREILETRKEFYDRNYYED